MRVGYLMRDKAFSRPLRRAQGKRCAEATSEPPVSLNNSQSDTFVITQIVGAHRHAGRFEIIINGEPFAVLSVDAIERLQLSVGVHVGDRLSALASEAAQLAVYDRALNMLAFRARSSSELARALVRKGSDPAHVSGAVARLVEQGFVDDAAFARAYTRSKVVGSNHSKRRVQQDLQRKGVARDVAAEAVGQVLVEEGIDQLALIEVTARKKQRLLGALAPAVRRRQLFAFLARRGFDSGDIQRVMNALGDPAEPAHEQ